MNTSYPRHHSHSNVTLEKSLRPVCAYCLHLLGAAGPGPMSPSRRREVEDDHQCTEKVIARQPHVALPFN